MMTRLLTKDEILDLHRWAIESFGGTMGLRDEGMLDSAIAQPDAGFGGVDLYPTLAEKAAALAFSLLKNHAFVDGNKRVAAWSLGLFLELNGEPWIVDPHEFEQVILATAAGETTRDAFFAWVASNVAPAE